MKLQNVQYLGEVLLEIREGIDVVDNVMIVTDALYRLIEENKKLLVDNTRLNKLVLGASHG